jgi:hypothetical protein
LLIAPQAVIGKSASRIDRCNIGVRESARVENTRPTPGGVAIASFHPHVYLINFSIAEIIYVWVGARCKDGRCAPRSDELGLTVVCNKPKLVLKISQRQNNFGRNTRNTRASQLQWQKKLLHRIITLMALAANQDTTNKLQ